MKKYEVAVGNGIALKCKIVSAKEYEDLIAQNSREVERKERELADLNRHIDELEVQISKLMLEISKLKGED